MPARYAGASVAVNCEARVYSDSYSHPTRPCSRRARCAMEEEGRTADLCGQHARVAARIGLAPVVKRG